MIQAIEPLKYLNTTVKVPLKVPLIASYLSKGYKPYQIADFCNVSDSAVSQYITKHLDKLLPLIDNTDGYAALNAKYIADLAQERLIKHLPKATKKDLFALNAISGTHIDKYRLLSDKSTQNVSMQVNDDNIKELDQGLLEDEEKLKRLTGES